MKGKTILLISPEPWGQNFVSKHHYANYLAKNNTIYFLNPPTGSSIVGGNNMDIKMSSKKENLVAIDYKNLMPKLDKLPKKLQLSIYSKQARLIQQKLSIDCFDIVWSFDPHRFMDQQAWTSTKSIYHSVDFHPNAQHELEIIESSDYYFGIANLIIDSLPSKKRAIKIGHGADIEGFKITTTINIPGNNSIKAMYVGNFHKHVDYNLLSQLSSENLDVDFILIGPTSKSNLSGRSSKMDVKAKFSSCKNVYFTGSVPPEKIMTYLNKADINLILFNEDAAKIHCNPHKIMGYLFSGKILISSYIDEYKEVDRNLMLIEEFNNLIPRTFKNVKENLSIYNSDNLKKLRRDFAIKNSYKNKIDEVYKIIFE